MTSPEFQRVASSALQAPSEQDRSQSEFLKKAQGDIISRQQEGMRQTAGAMSWDQSWKDVRKARQSSPEGYRSSRQKRFSQRYPQ